MSKHTLGTWKWWMSNSFPRLSGLDGKDGGVLCQIVSKSDGYPDLILSKANTELVEAAPDLLEVLKGALGWFNNGLAREHYDKAVSAIAKRPKVNHEANRANIAVVAHCCTQTRGRLTIGDAAFHHRHRDTPNGTDIPPARGVVPTPSSNEVALSLLAVLRARNAQCNA
ncbi:MAG: hypothetical protein ACR5LD_05155 [Symbiopectobacterium sp.]